MERSLPSSAVVFDIGGVIARPSSVTDDDASRSLDADPADLARAYWRHRDDYDREGSPAQYWQRVGEDVGLHLTPSQVQALDAADAARWSTPAPGVEALLTDLAATGLPLAVLSNAPASLAAAVRAASWSAPFAVLAFSCELGASKPHPQAYRATSGALGIAGSDLLFFDDRPANLDGARACGWTPHLWRDPHTGRRVLTEAGVLA